MIKRNLIIKISYLALFLVLAGALWAVEITEPIDPTDPAELEGAEKLYALLSANPELQTQIRDIADKLRCPICQGLSVKESESQISLSMRYKIGELLQQGHDEQGVLNYFEQRYGEWIFREPKKDGINLWLWWLPFILLLLGLVLLVFWSIQHRHALQMENENTDAEGVQ